MAVTIKDVAAAAGVSPSTVSRTCKDSPSISRETKERVRRIMAQLGYEPNFEAEPVEAFSKTIGIILPSSQRDVYENAFHLEIIRGIGQFCNQRRYVNTVITGQDDTEVLDAIQSMVANAQADGFILLYSKRTARWQPTCAAKGCSMSLWARRRSPPIRPSISTTATPLPVRKPPITSMKWATAALPILVSATPCCFRQSAGAATRCPC
ncbi:MAG: LacI family DNA-binding transcriptional regulator [Faecalibacterium sp.]